MCKNCRFSSRYLCNNDLDIFSDHKLQDIHFYLVIFAFIWININIFYLFSSFSELLLTTRLGSSSSTGEMFYLLDIFVNFSHLASLQIIYVIC